jgi:hypothetical protein
MSYAGKENGCFGIFACAIEINGKISSMDGIKEIKNTIEKTYNIKDVVIINWRRLA